MAIVFPGNNVSAKYGLLGSAHEHAAVIVDLNGTNVDFAQPKYMIRSNYIHMETTMGYQMAQHYTDMLLMYQ
jgi:hypothetical protein